MLLNFLRIGVLLNQHASHSEINDLGHCVVNRKAADIMRGDGDIVRFQVAVHYVIVVKVG